MGRKFDYQYIVIGSGAAGGAAALLAASLKAKVALVEADRWGGATLNYRDVPYLAALEFAQNYTRAVAAARMGVSSDNLRFNYPSALSWQATAMRRAGANSKKVFEAAGIDCYHGFAQFINSHEIAVEKQQITGERFLLATGSTLAVNGITGIDTVTCWSPDTALKMAKLPKSMIIIGAGATGCELAEYFGALGVKTVLLEAKDRILPNEDEDASEAISKHLRQDLNVKILTNARAIALEPAEKQKKVVFLRGGQEKALRVASVVLATSPEPQTDLGLENAGVKFTYRGIKVNKTLQTSVKHIYAAGDAIGGESSTEKANYEGRLATLNALKHTGSMVNYTGFARVTNTYPKVAKIGLNETECKQLRLKPQVATVELRELCASNVADFREGFVKLLANRKKQVIGATIVAPEAEIVIQELAMALRAGLTTEELAATPHVASSWSEAIRMAARKLAG